MHSYTKSFLPTLWSRLNGIASQELDRADQIALIKEEILNNITLILNSRSHLSAKELQSEDISLSVLGLGLADFCGKNHQQSRLNALKAQIITQISFFEPRLDPESIELTLLDKENELGPNSPNYINIEIKARLQPSLSAELFTCVSRVDLDSGDSSIEEHIVPHKE